MEQTSPPRDQETQQQQQQQQEQDQQRDQQQQQGRDEQREQQDQQPPLPPRPQSQENQQQQQQQQQQQVPRPQYLQTQQPFQPQGSPMRPIHMSARGMWSSKLALRMISMAFCLIIIGCSAHLSGIWDPYPIIMFGPPACIGFIWSFAESICLCARRGHRGIHPGACVALDLLLWMGYVVSVSLLAVIGTDNYYYYDYDFYLISVPLYRVVFAFGILEILLHVVLFIIACYETHIRNRNTQVVFVQSGPSGAFVYPPNLPMTQVYQQPPMQFQPSTPAQHPFMGYYAPQGQLQTNNVPPATTTATTTTTTPPVAPVQPPQVQPSGQQQ